MPPSLVLNHLNGLGRAAPISQRGVRNHLPPTIGAQPINHRFSFAYFTFMPAFLPWLQRKKVFFPTFLADS